MYLDLHAPEKLCLTGNLGPCSGLERAIPISVIPYLSNKVCPKFTDYVSVQLKAAVQVGVSARQAMRIVLLGL